MPRESGEHPVPGSWLYDESARAYLAVFAAVGALNYGHEQALKQGIARKVAG